MADEKLMDRARDELFSHINRCGVLQAEADDQRTWMDETIEYIAERYPDLSDVDLEGLHGIGIRFCQPAIAYGNGTGAAIDLIRRSVEEEGEATETPAEAPESVQAEAPEAPEAVKAPEAADTTEASEASEVEEVGAA
jgi:hypothetical protein